MSKRSKSLYNRNYDDHSIVQNIQRVYTIYNNYETIIIQKNVIIEEQKEEIQYLKDNQVIYLGTGGYVIDEVVELKVNTVVAMDYITYITLYGVPEDGIFDQALLDAIAADAAEAKAKEAANTATQTTDMTVAGKALADANAAATIAATKAANAQEHAFRDAQAAASAAQSAEEAAAAAAQAQAAYDALT